HRRRAGTPRLRRAGPGRDERNGGVRGRAVGRRTRSRALRTPASRLAVAVERLVATQVIPALARLPKMRFGGSRGVTDRPLEHTNQRLVYADHVMTVPAPGNASR